MEQFDTLPELDDLISVVGDRVDIGEDMIEVDGVSTEEVEPFGLGKLWNRFVAVKQRGSGSFNVSREILEESVGFL